MKSFEKKKTNKITPGKKTAKTMEFTLDYLEKCWFSYVFLEFFFSAKKRKTTDVSSRQEMGVSVLIEASEGEARKSLEARS